MRHNQIESRRRVTNQAIVDAVMERAPGAVLDIGCGEGWLVRALAGRVERRVGVDAIASLVAQAEAAGGGEFRVASYDDIHQGVIEERFDVAVCNFSLIGKASVEALIRAVPSLLAANGALIVQTLHPLMACGEAPYVDGWREGSWNGFDQSFVDPAPWYFRTLSGWCGLFASAGLQVGDIREPLHPDTGKPASLILIGTVAPSVRASG